MEHFRKKYARNNKRAYNVKITGNQFDDSKRRCELHPDQQSADGTFCQKLKHGQADKKTDIIQF